MRLRRTSKVHYAGVLSRIAPLMDFAFMFGYERAAFSGGLDDAAPCGIMHITERRRSRLAEMPPEDKAVALRRHHALNPSPQAVGDSAFTSCNAFFDPPDLVQAKYELLPR